MRAAIKGALLYYIHHSSIFPYWFVCVQLCCVLFCVCAIVLCCAVFCCVVLCFVVFLFWEVQKIRTDSKLPKKE